MIIDKVYLEIESICIVVQGYENHHLAFELEDVANVDALIQKIKAKITEIDAGPAATPPTDWQPFFNELKTALEGLDVGD